MLIRWLGLKRLSPYSATSSQDPVLFKDPGFPYIRVQLFFQQKKKKDSKEKRKKEKKLNPHFKQNINLYIIEFLIFMEFLSPSQTEVVYTGF